MKLLLHTCCAPCLTGSRTTFEDEGFEPTALWYNPNIHPFTEYDRRLQTLERYIYLRPIESIVIRDYDLWPFMKGLLHCISGMSKPSYGRTMSMEERRIRCRYCYQTRFTRTADLAAEKGFDAFSTTLLLSPYQDHELVKEVCSEISEGKEIDFVYKDLRRNWKGSIETSRELGLYRQPYCGCIFSEQERYLNARTRRMDPSTNENDPDPGEENR